MTVPPERWNEVPIRTVDDRPPSAGLTWHIAASVLLMAGWLAFVILWLSFFASDRSGYQNLAVILASLVVLGVLLGAAWAGFGRRVRQWFGPGRDRYYYGNVQRSRWARRVIWLGWAVAFIAWLLYYADNFTGYQNLAVLIVSLLIAGGLSMAVRWTLGR